MTNIFFLNLLSVSKLLINGHNTLHGAKLAKLSWLLEADFAFCTNLPSQVNLPSKGKQSYFSVV